MTTQPGAPSPVPVDRQFLKNIHAGSRLFHYPSKGNSVDFFDKSPSVEYTLYSVIDLPTDDEVVLLGAFDRQEKKNAFSRDQLMNGEWWYAPADKGSDER